MSYKWPRRATRALAWLLVWVRELVEAFLEKLTYASDNDGQVVVDLGDKFRDSRGSQTISSLEVYGEP